MKLKNGYGPSLLLVLFILATYGISSSGESNKGVPLFSEIITQAELGNVDDPTVIRQRTANVNFKSLLNENIPPETALNAADSIILNLFEDVRLTAVLDRLDATLPEFYSWIGHIAGMAQSKVILVVGDGLIKGSVTMPDAFYKISHIGNDTHVIYEIDQTRFPPESDPIPVNSEKKAIAFDAISADSASTIDVMFFYTTAAKNDAAGKESIQAEIIEALQDTNEGYLDSGVSHSIELIPFENYTPEIVDDESNFDWVDTLVGLRRPVDAYADHVHTLRDQHSADIVVLIVEGDNLFCGASYSMANLSSAFEAYAFSVVSRRCATIRHSLGHELGHVMGSQHDHATAENNDEVGVFDYSYGYQAPDQSFRTIMAYDCPDGCTRVNYWSNPDNEAYNGEPMGETNVADNTRSLNDTAYTVANFRISEQLDKTISGRVTDTAGAGIQGVTITFSNGGGTTTTRSNGNYSRSVTYGWSGSATPSKSGYNFNPPSTPYSNVTSNQSGKNFTGTAAGGSDPGSNGGTPDSPQNNAVSLSTFDNQHQVTLETPDGINILDYRAMDNPDSENSPDSVEFSYGFFEFTVEGVEPGGATTVTLQFPAGASYDTYYKYGPTRDNTSNYWYEFKYDGQTGAEINGSQIILHFVDGQRGDDDLVANGVVTDIGGPGVSATVTPSGDESPDAESSGSGGGGGGCFIGSISYGGWFGGSF